MINILNLIMITKVKLLINYYILSTLGLLSTKSKVCSHIIVGREMNAFVFEV